VVAMVVWLACLPWRGGVAMHVDVVGLPALERGGAAVRVWLACLPWREEVRPCGCGWPACPGEARPCGAVGLPALEEGGGHGVVGLPAPEKRRGHTVWLACLPALEEGGGHGVVGLPAPEKRRGGRGVVGLLACPGGEAWRPWWCGSHIKYGRPAYPREEVRPCGVVGLPALERRGHAVRCGWLACPGDQLCRRL
jgi:hypothetical protein